MSAVARLRAAGCVAANEEATAFIEAAPDRDTLDGWLRRREQGEPPEWITGAMQFCGRALRIDAGVYVPRRQSGDWPAGLRLSFLGADGLSTCAPAPAP